MKKVFGLILLLTFLFSVSCNKKEAGIAPPSKKLSYDEMKSVLTDVFLAEAAVATFGVKQHNPKYYARHYFDFVMKRHNINRKQFWENYSYYSSRQEEMDNLLNDVLSDLSKKQAEQ